MTGFAEIPRQAAARQIAELLDTAPWVHVHGAAGLGKDETAAALVEHLSASRLVAFVSAAPHVGVSEPDLARALLRSVAKTLDLPPQAAFNPNALNGDVGRPLFEAMSAMVAPMAANAPPVIVIDRADWFLFCEVLGLGFIRAALTAQNATDLRFRLVTLSTFPVTLLRPELSGGAEFPLRPFAAPKMDEFGFAAPSAIRSELDGEPAWNDILNWFRPKRDNAEANSQSSCLTEDGLRKLLDRFVELQRGQPRLVMTFLASVLDAMANAPRGSQPVGPETINAVEEAWRANAEAFRAEMYPEICVAEHLPGPLAREVADRVSAYRALLIKSNARVHTDDDQNNDWYRALGLLIDLPGDGHAAGPVAAFPGMINWLDDDVLRTAIGRLRAHSDRWDEVRKERSAAQDRFQPAIEARVRRAFCDTPTGLARGYQFNEYETDALEQGIHYRITLTRDVDGKSDLKRRTAGRQERHNSRVTETLHVFRNLTSHGEQLWLRTAALLRRLSTAPTSALVTLHRGGILAAEQDDPPEIGDLSYVLLDEPGEPLTKELEQVRSSLCAPRRRAGQEAPPHIAEQITQLAFALRCLHVEGIAHRRIAPDTVRASFDAESGAPHLLLTGFEFAVYIKDAVAASRSSADTPEVGFAPNVIPFRTADQLNLAAMGLDDATANLTGWSGADLNGLGALIALLIIGPVEADILQCAYEALTAIPHADSERSDKCREILKPVREAMLDPERWARATEKLPGAYSIYLDTVRCLVADMTQGHGRPSERINADYIHRSLKLAADTLRNGLSSASGDAFAVLYDTKHMGPKLRELGLINFATDTPDGAAELHDTLEDWLLTAQGIHYFEDGFIGAVRDTAEDRQKAAKYVIVCEEVVFFAAYFAFHGSRDDDRVLRLAFTMRREHVRLPFIDEDPPVPFPEKFELLSSREITRKRLDSLSSWQPRLEEARMHQAKSTRQIAAASLDFHRRLELAKEQLKVFPVRVTQERNAVVFRLDVEKYRKAIDAVRSFEARLVLNGRDMTTFFVDSMEEWQQDVDAGSAKLQFRPIGLMAGRPFDVDLRSVEAAECSAGPDDRFSQAGQLVFSDLRGATVASERQQGAVKRLMQNGNLIDHLENPRSDAPMQLPLSVVCGPDLGDVTRRTIQNMKSGVPLSVLQGPPGTGKTTVIANLVAELLRDDETTRILIASQSHAATDTTMNRVVSTCTAQFDDNAPDAIRLLSTAGMERVSPTIRAQYSAEAHVEIKRDRAEQRCKKRLNQEQDPRRKQAYEMLGSALKGATFELWTRIERTASLVFGTTAAASQAGQLPGLGSSRDASGRFDVVVIDEAAKAYGIDLVQPLSIASRAIMVGDAAQLPPFDMQGTLDLYDRARAIYLKTRDVEELPPDVALICDSDNYDDAKSWLTPFARTFDKCPPIEDAAADTDARVPLSQKLLTQYRSVEPIGRLVSNTFYEGKITTAAHLHKHDYAQDVLFTPLVRGGQTSPVVTWLDTSGLDADQYGLRAGREGKLWNAGECKLAEWVVDQARSSFGDDHRLPERLKVMSPYASQVAALKRRLRDHNTLGHAVQPLLDEIVQTVDSAQGAEADLVVVSMVRSGRLVSTSRTDAESRKRDLFRNFGFLASSERLNVTFSRARRNLVIIGDFEFFSGFDKLLNSWIDAEPTPENRREIIHRHGFWKALLDQFPDPGLTSDIMRIAVADLDEFVP